MTNIELIKQILPTIDKIKFRIYWIERTRYALNEEEIKQLIEVNKILATIEKNVSDRC